MSRTNGTAAAETAVMAGQAAAAERLARAIVLAFEVCDEGGVPLSEVQKIAIVQGALLEFDGLAAQLESTAAVAELLRDVAETPAGIDLKSILSPRKGVETVAIHADITEEARRFRFRTRGERPPAALGPEDLLGVAGLLGGMTCNRVLLRCPEEPIAPGGRHALATEGGAGGGGARAGRATRMGPPEKTTAEVRARSSRDDRLTEEQLLGRAAELVARGWTREGRAQDGLGHPVAPWSDRARRWSPVGALQRVWHESGGGPLEIFEAAYLALSLATGGRLDEWNAAPWRTKWHVLSAFTRARKLLPDAREQLGISP